MPSPLSAKRAMDDSLLDTPSAFGRARNLGGAGVTTQLQLAQLAYEERPRYVRLLGLFDPFLREFVEMHYLLTDPLIVDDSALKATRNHHQDAL